MIRITFLIIYFFSFTLHCKNIEEKIKSGDIIFRKEDSFLSNRFEKLDGRGFSHIGLIYLKDKDIYVLHIERTQDKKDLKLDLLDTFLRGATKWKIMRVSKKENLKDINENIKKVISENPSFDFNFNLKSDEKLYCTELIYKFFKNNYNIVLTKQRKDFGFYNYISVGSILESKKLKRITSSL